MYPGLGDLLCALHGKVLPVNSSPVPFPKKAREHVRLVPRQLGSMDILAKLGTNGKTLLLNPPTAYALSSSSLKPEKLMC